MESRVQPQTEHRRGAEQFQEPSKSYARNFRSPQPEFRKPTYRDLSKSRIEPIVNPNISRDLSRSRIESQPMFQNPDGRGIRHNSNQRNSFRATTENIARQKLPRQPEQQASPGFRQTQSSDKEDKAQDTNFKKHIAILQQPPIPEQVETQTEATA